MVKACVTFGVLLLATATVLMGPTGASASTPVCTITGTSGPDILTGTSGNDVICGLGGNDTISGVGGADTVYGGGGADTIYGQGGADAISGNAGNDKLFGNAGNDTLSGGLGSDYLNGGTGTNTCTSGGQSGDVMTNSCDTTPPVLVGFTFTTPSVDTSSGPVTVKADAQVTDDISGVKVIQCLYDSPSKASSIFTTVPPTLSGHTASEWDYTLEASLPENSEQGTWTVRYCVVNDSVNNQRYYLGSDMNGLGFDSTFEQTGSGDATPPAIVGFDIAASIATGSGSQTLDATVDITEADSGVKFVQCQYRAPDGILRIDTGSAPQLLSQSGSDWVFRVSATMPQYSPQGTWTVEWCTAVDNANNQASLDTSQIEAAGYPTTFDESDPGDSTAPSVTDFGFTSPATVSVGSGDATITATVQATDDLSGLHVYMACQYVAPSGTVTAELTGYTGTPGALQADYSLSMTIPQYSQTGTWTLSSCSPEDRVGNRASVTQSEMQAAGFPTTFTVQ